MLALRILFALTLVFGPAVQVLSAQEASAQEVPMDARAALSERLQKEALACVEASTAAYSGSRTFRVLRPPQVPQLPPGEVRFELSHLSKSDATGPFFAAFKILVNDRPAGSARVDLEGRWTGKLLKARGPLARQSVPGPEDIEEVDFVGTPPAGALLSFPEGFRLKIPMIAGHVLTRMDIQAIPIIKAGEQVRVELICGTLSVTLEATARSNAALGEKVRLELPSGRKPLQAVATAPGEARVDWKS
jgi:flagella basal body P-ring formation protein FlgA